MIKRQLLTAVLLLFVSLSSAQAMGGRAGGQPKPGQVAPDFTLTDLSGNKITLSALRGKVVFLNFWATWCPPCRAEMPSMEQLNEVFSGKDFVMLAVNVEQNAESVVKAFIKRNPHSFTVLLDGEGEVQKLYGVYRFPETFLIDRQGRVVEHVLGARNWASVEFLRQVNGLLGE